MPWAYNTPRKRGRRRKSGKKMRNVATAVLGAGCIANSADTPVPRRLFIFLVIIS